MMLNLVVGQEFMSIATVQGPKGYKYKVTNGGIETTNFREKLRLKVGSRVSLIINLNVIDDLVNGALGTVVGIESNHQNEMEAIIVKFDQDKTGRAQRQKYPKLSAKYTNSNGTPILKYNLEYLIRKGNAARAKVSQFPICLAWAFTAHKTQVSL